MSLEQYKDRNRAELWEVLQIQAQVLQGEIRKNTELERLAREVLATSTFAEDFQKILDRLEELLEQGE